jgi:hypothetical protein
MSTERIHVDIVDKPQGVSWRIIGSCPTSVTESGGLHVYAGRNALVRDCATDEVIVGGRSLADVLTKLATLSGLTVVLTDELTSAETVYQPSAVSR